MVFKEMEPEYSSDRLPEKLTVHLNASRGDRRFRRRAVLTNANGQWDLVCCTIEGFLPGAGIPEPVTSRRYSQATLHEDWLTEAECMSFATELQEGHGHIGDIGLQRGQTPQWHTQLVPVKNDFMPSAGYVIGLRSGLSGTRASVRTLLAPDQPYYPDIDEAARDWLPFPVYHGSSDARNDQIFFLLPETRAFIAGAKFSDSGTLDVTLAGTEIDALPLLIKGAYWEDKSIHHFETQVCESNAVLTVPTDTDRLEYYLIDREGMVFDFHREDRFSRLSADGRTATRTLEDQVRKASSDGEGLNVEFKPFVDPEQKLTSGNQKTKLHEIITTVVAFANTDGGYIYLGVDDDCHITGVDLKLSEWANSAINESTINRYLGTLKSKIKDIVHGEIALRLSHVQVDGVLVVVIEVPPAVSKPVTIRQDNYLYARTGASNRKVPPDQWRSVLEPHRSINFP